MLDQKSRPAAVVIDSSEPGIDTGIENDVLAEAVEHVLADGIVLLGKLVLERVQIGTDAVHPVADAELGHLIPEFTRIVIAKSRNQAIFLHILCAEGLIKIVHDCQFFHNVTIIASFYIR